jgi:hypothetical protein
VNVHRRYDVGGLAYGSLGKPGAVQYGDYPERVNTKATLNKFLPCSQTDKVRDMKQQTLAMAADLQSGFEHYRKPTQRDKFLNTMEAIVP